MSALYNIQPLPKALIWSVTVSIVGSFKIKGVPRYLSLVTPELNEVP